MTANPGRSSPQRPEFTLGQIVEALGGELVGSPAVSICGVAPLDSAGETQISFLASSKYRPQLAVTRAGAVVLGPSDKEATERPRIVAQNPYAYFARVSSLLNPDPVPTPGVHRTAAVDPSARVAATATVGANAVIEAGAEVGDGAHIGPCCVVGENAVVGAGSRLYPNVTIYHGCHVGKRCIVHSGVVIGGDGFGMAEVEGRWIKVPQVGRAVIGDDVEIGANTCIDRGALEDTVLEDGVKLDNLVQIGHNVHVGAHTAMAGCAGVAGSARIGRHCTLGGGAIVLGHLELADHVHITAATVVTRSIREPGRYSGLFPFDDNASWEKNAATLRQLHSLRERIRALEKKP